MSEVSREDKVEIATNFMLSSPPGEFMEVVTDVRGLLGDESIINDSAPGTFKEYFTDQMTQIPSSKGHQFLLTKHGEVGDSEFLDPRGGQVVSYDFIRQEVTGTRSISGELDHDVEPFRAAVDNALQTYVEDHYQNGAGTVYSGKESDGSYRVVVCISSSLFNPGNFWNGRWRSTWTAKFRPGAQVQLSGHIKANVHYYEEGNVQLNTDVTKALTANASDPNAMAAEVVKLITRTEANYQSKLEQSYNTMGETTFKALRRVLPITRSKIDWNRIKNYRIGSEMSNARG